MVDEREAPPARKIIRQAWSKEEKCRIVVETLVPGASVSEIAAAAKPELAVRRVCGKAVTLSRYHRSPHICAGFVRCG